MSTRRPKGSVNPNVLDCLADELIAHGSAPPAATIAELLEMTPQMVTRALRQLLDEGAVIQPYGERGPYVPLHRSDGTPVRLVLVEEGNQAEQDVLMELVGKLPAEKRTAAEAYLRFLLEGGG